MKLKKLLALITICALMLTGCNSDKKYNEFMEDGIEAVKQESYNEALRCFSSALEEKEGDSEATSLYDQVEKILEAKAKMSAELYDSAIKVCDEIMKSQSNSTVVKDIATELKEECEKLKEEKEADSKNEDEESEEDKESSEEDEYKVDFNDELKAQIKNAGVAYVQYYLESEKQISPSEFANKAYEDTENDTPLNEYKEEGRKIFVDAFKEAYEATGNKYY